MSDVSNQLVIGDDNFESQLGEKVDGEQVARGLIPRDMEANPRGCYESIMAVDIPTIPMEEWPERIKEMERTKTRLSDIRRRANNGKHIPALDQNGQGYCWAYGPTMAVMLLRAIANMPYIRLSGHSVGCKVKNFRDQGGWGALALDFISKNGVAPVSKWPEKSMSRNNDSSSTWDEAAKFAFTESWVDLQSPVYDRDLSEQQSYSCLLSRLPVPSDFMWWGHHVCCADAVDVYPDRSARDISRYGKRIINSWKDSYGDLGEAVLKDKKALADNAVAPRTVAGA